MKRDAVLFLSALVLGAALATTSNGDYVKDLETEIQRLRFEAAQPCPVPATRHREQLPRDWL